jgi:cell division protein FtsQ
MLEKVPVIRGLKISEIVLYEKLKILKEDQSTEQKAGQNQDQNLSRSTGQNSTEKAGQKSEQNSDKSDAKTEEPTDKIFNVIIGLTQLINKYELNVDTVTFSSNYEVTLDIGSITVLLGKKSTYDEALAELKNILKEADGMGITLDMRNYVEGTDSIIAKQKKSTE